MRVPPSVLPRRLIAALGLAWLCLKTIRKNDVVILYNYFPEFLLAALILKLKGHPAFLDVEDAPNPDDRSLREHINRLCLPAVSALTRKEKIIVSHALAKRMGLSDYFVAYGVARQQQRAATAERQPGSILFGGSIMRETGLDLFRDAVRILATRPRATPLEFHVTGNFSRADFDDLLAEIASSASVKLTLHADLTREDYLALTTRVQTGLSLKPARGVMGEATFPPRSWRSPPRAWCCAPPRPATWACCSTRTARCCSIRKRARNWPPPWKGSPPTPPPPHGSPNAVARWFTSGSRPSASAKPCWRSSVRRFEITPGSLRSRRTRPASTRSWPGDRKSPR